MAIRKEPGGITPTGDAENQRVKGISDVAKTVNEMQRNVDKEIMRTESYVEERKDMQEIQSSMNGVLRKLSDTIGALTVGVKNVTSSTAMATKDAISQYGRAVGEDISFKKQNIVAMALARSTPIFGYFAAKFMETDVFKKAAARMREQVGRAFGGIANIFRRGKEAREETIPKMQTGGIVEKGGLAELHPAEVVMPIDDLLKRIDQSMSTTRQLAIVARKAQLKTLGDMGTFVQTAEKKQRVGIVKGFLRAYAEVNSQYLEPDSKRQLRALLAIQDALGAQIGTWKQVWQKMLIEHPMFRNIMFLSRTMGKVFTMPVGAVAAMVRDRGGYSRVVSTSKNPMQATAETLGAYAIENLWIQDSIRVYTRATAEAVRDLSGSITGKKYKALPGLSEGFWSVLGFGRNILNFFGKWTPALAGSIAGGILGGRPGLKEGWLKGKGIGEILTEQRELPAITWRGRLERERAMGLGEVEGGFERGGPIPVFGTAETEQQKLGMRIQEFMLPYYKSGAKLFPMLEKKYFPEQIAWQPKLLEWKKKEANEYLPAIAEATVEENQRGARQTIWRWLLAAGPLLKSILSGVLGMWLSPLKKFGGLFTKGGLMAAMSSPAAFAKFLGPAASVLGAGALGYGLGTVIERSLIAPIRERHFAELDAAKREARVGAAEATKKFQEARARVMAGKGTEKDREMMKLMGKTHGQFGKMAAERAKYIQGGFMERIMGDTDVLNIVTDAQRGYFSENIDQYLPYGTDQVMRLRAQFNQRARGAGIDYRKDPVAAGRKREAMFLAYLKKNATPYMDLGMGGGVPLTMMETAKIKGREVVGAAQEMMSPAVDKARMVKTAVQQEVAKVKVYSDETLKNMDKMSEKIVEGGKQQVNAISNMSTSFVNNMSNSMANSVAAGRRGLGEMQEDLTASILHGRMQ